jgi:hypothetical protein
MVITANVVLCHHRFMPSSMPLGRSIFCGRAGGRAGQCMAAHSAEFSRISCLFFLFYRFCERGRRG